MATKMAEVLLESEKSSPEQIGTCLWCLKGRFWGSKNSIKALFFFNMTKQYTNILENQDECQTGCHFPRISINALLKFWQT